VPRGVYAEETNSSREECAERDPEQRKQRAKEKEQRRLSLLHTNAAPPPHPPPGRPPGRGGDHRSIGRSAEGGESLMREKERESASGDLKKPSRPTCPLTHLIHRSLSRTLTHTHTHTRTHTHTHSTHISTGPTPPGHSRRGGGPGGRRPARRLPIHHLPPGRLARGRRRRRRRRPPRPAPAGAGPGRGLPAPRGGRPADGRAGARSREAPEESRWGQRGGGGRAPCARYLPRRVRQ